VSGDDRSKRFCPPGQPALAAAGQQAFVRRIGAVRRGRDTPELEHAIT
jgi:hypothetical protein